MQTKKNDGTLNCALCDKPRKDEYHTICDEHKKEWLRLARRERRIHDVDPEFREFDRRIKENLQ